MKRVQWLYAIGKRVSFVSLFDANLFDSYISNFDYLMILSIFQEIGPRDRVCSVHFRRGKPSGDPSQEDFAPHLYLNKEPPQEVFYKYQ